MSLVEAQTAANNARLNELEPMVGRLVNAGEVAGEVRAALQQANRDRWSNKQRLQAITGGVLIAIASNANWHSFLHHLLR
jgi:hypothetical protein